LNSGFHKTTIQPYLWSRHFRKV